MKIFDRLLSLVTAGLLLWTGTIGIRHEIKLHDALVLLRKDNDLIVNLYNQVIDQQKELRSLKNPV